MPSYGLFLNLPSGGLFNINFETENVFSYAQMKQKFPNLSLAIVDAEIGLKFWFFQDFSIIIIPTLLHVLARDNNLKF